MENTKERLGTNDESESSGSAGLSVLGDRDRGDLSELGEGLGEGLLVRRPGEVSDVELGSGVSTGVVSSSSGGRVVATLALVSSRLLLESTLGSTSESSSLSITVGKVDLSE